MKRKQEGPPPAPLRVQLERNSFREKLNEQSHKEAVNDRISKADHRIYGIEYQLGKWSAIYTFARWEANRAARSLLPFKTKEYDVGFSPFLRSPDRKAGLPKKAPFPTSRRF